LTGIDPETLLQSADNNLSEAQQARFPLRMLSRYVVVEGRKLNSTGASPKLPVETEVPVVLEYEIESGLYNPCWTSIEPHEVRGCWKLQVIPTDDRPIALLIFLSLPIMWSNIGWTGTQAADFTFQSPSHLKSIVHSVRVRPV
jgi:hypothetical protein